MLPWREVVNQPPQLGDLRIEEARDAERRRYVRSAKLFREDAIVFSTALPELHDVRIVSMSPQAFTLAGFERVEGCESAQSWLVALC